MRLIISIELDNAAFQDDEAGRLECREVARILADIAERLPSFVAPARGNCHDINGNHVGEWAIVDG